MSKKTERRITAEVPVSRPKEVEPAKVKEPAPKPARRASYSKGDGMTTDKAALPSELRPDISQAKQRGVVKPGATKPAVPAPKTENPLMRRRASGGYNKGDGITTAKPSLPEGDAQPMVRSDAPSFRIRPGVGQPGPSRVGNPTTANTLDQVKQRLLPKSAPEAMAEKRRRVAQGALAEAGAGRQEPNLLAQASQAVEAESEEADDESALPKISATVGSPSAPPTTTTGSTTWSQAIKGGPPANPSIPRPTEENTGAELVPEEFRPLTAENKDQFKIAYLDALEKGEQWAKDLSRLAMMQLGRLRRELIDREDFLGGAAVGDITEAAGLIKDEIAAQVEASTPWAIASQANASVAEQRQANEAAARQIEQAKKLSNTSFESSPPQVYEGPDKKAAENFERDPSTPLPTADDGSMKVPAQKGKFVNEYIRTNPIVEQLQMADAAHMYNPVYATHLQATVEAAGSQNGPPPPQGEGKGFLAMTAHGFGYVWNPSYTVEQNRMAAEFTLKTGMPFEKCDGLKLPEALDQFNNWDPSQKGELKIVLDKHKSGKDKVSLKSDGEGTITASFYTRHNRTERLKDNVEKYGLEVAAIVLMCIPGTQPVAVAIVNTAIAAKNAYKAVKSGDWFGAVVSVAAGFAGLSKLPNVPTKFANFANTVGNVGQAVQSIKGTIDAARSGSIAGIVAGLGNVATSFASVAGGQVAADFEKLAELAKKYGPAIALGESAYNALKKGDYASAFIEGVRFAAKTFPDKFPVPQGMDRAEFLKKLEGAAVALQGVNSAIQSGDYGAAVSSLLSGVQSVTQEVGPDGKPLPSRGQHYLSAGIALSGAISQLERDNPAAAAALAGKFISELNQAIRFNQQKLDDPKVPEAEKRGLPKLIEDLKKQVDHFGGIEKLNAGIQSVVQAVKSGKPDAILEEATAFLGQITGREGFTVASEVISAVRNAISAVKRGDFVSITAAQAALQRALNDARSYIDKVRSPPPGEEQQPGEAPAVVQGQDPKDPFGILRPGNPQPSDGSAVGEPTGPGGAQTVAYRVQTGDSLSRIAERELGDRNRWPEIYELNKELIGDNPNVIKVGLLLKMPPPDFVLSDARRQEITGIKPPKGGTPTNPAPTGPASSPELNQARQSYRDYDQALKEARADLQDQLKNKIITQAQHAAAKAKLDAAATALGDAKKALDGGKADSATSELQRAGSLIGEAYSAANTTPRATGAEPTDGSSVAIDALKSQYTRQRNEILAERTDLAYLKDQGKISEAAFQKANQALNDAATALTRADQAIKAGNVEKAKAELGKASQRRAEASQAAGVQLGTEIGKPQLVLADVKPVIDVIKALGNIADDVRGGSDFKQAIDLLDQTVKLEEKLRSEGKTAGEDYQKVLQTLNTLKSSGTIADAVSKGFKAFGTELTDATADNKEVLSRLARFNSTVGGISKVVAIPQMFIGIADKIQIICGYKPDGKEATVTERLSAAQSILGDVGKLGEELKWVGTLARSALTKLGAGAKAEWASIIGGALKKVPAEIGDYLLGKLTPLLAKLEQKAGGKLAVETAKKIASFLGSEAFGKMLAAQSPAALKLVAGEVASKLIGIFRVASGPAGLIAYEIAKLEAEFAMELGAKAYTALANTLITQAFGKNPEDIRREVEAKPLGTQQQADDFIFWAFNGFLHDSTPQIKGDWEAYARKEMMSLLPPSTDTQLSLQDMLERLSPEVRAFAAVKLQQVAGAFVTAEVKKLFYGD